MMRNLLWLALLALLIDTHDVSAQTTRSPEPAVYSRGTSMRVVTADRTTERPQADRSEPGGFPALAPRTADTTGIGTEQPAPERNQLAAPAITVTSSLAVVLALFAALVWLARKYGSRSIAPGAIPQEVLESLGSTAIDSRTRITMLRCGGRILVLAQTPTGVQPISEITDSEEVRRLTAACLGHSKRSFAGALETIEKEKTAPGFVEPSPTTPETPRSRGRLFATA